MHDWDFTVTKCILTSLIFGLLMVGSLYQEALSGFYSSVFNGRVVPVHGETFTVIALFFILTGVIYSFVYSKMKFNPWYMEVIGAVGWFFGNLSLALTWYANFTSIETLQASHTTVTFVDIFIVICGGMVYWPIQDEILLHAYVKGTNYKFILFMFLFGPSVCILLATVPSFKQSESITEFSQVYDTACLFAATIVFGFIVTTEEDKNEEPVKKQSNKMDKNRIALHCVSVLIQGYLFFLPSAYIIYYLNANQYSSNQRLYTSLLYASGSALGILLLPFVYHHNYFDAILFTINMIQFICYICWMLMSRTTGVFQDEMYSLAFFLGLSTPSLFYGLFLRTSSFYNVDGLDTKNKLYYLTHMLLLVPGIALLPIVFGACITNGVVNFTTFLIISSVMSFISWAGLLKMDLHIEAESDKLHIG
jgi:hypothetical protein